MNHSTQIEMKKQVMILLQSLNLKYEFINENEIKIIGKNDIYGTFLTSGYFKLEKDSRLLNRKVQKWTCKGMQAIESYLRQHALNLPRFDNERKKN